MGTLSWNERVLVVMPLARDAKGIEGILAEAGLAAVPCPSLEECCRCMSEGAGALLVSEAVLVPKEAPVLLQALKEQPAWSDVPVLIVRGRRTVAQGLPAILESLQGSVTLLEQPLRQVTLVSLVRSALRGRRRQYQVRDLLARQAESEEALRRAKQDWEWTFDSMPDLIAVLDKDYRVRRVNRALAKRLGRAPRDCVGELCYECLRGLGCAEEACPRNLSLGGGLAQTVEVGEKQPLGGFLVSATPLRDERGEVVGVVHVSRDITARLEAEQKLRESEQRLRLAVATAKLGVYERDLTTNKAVYDAELRSMLGLPEGVSDPEAARQSVHPEDRERVMGALGRVLDPAVQAVASEEYRIVRPDGEVRWLTASGRALFEGQGASARGIKLLGVVQDVTERKRIEGELAAMLEREREARREAESARAQFRALFESAPGLYLVLAPEDFRIVAVSDAYLEATMTQRSQIMGRSMFEVFPENPAGPPSDGLRNLRASLERVRRTHQSDVMAVQRHPIPRPAEQGGGFEERYWSPINSPVFGAEGRLASIIHRVEDVTEFVHLKQQEGAWPREEVKLASKGQRMEAEVVLRSKELQQFNERLRASEEQLRAANRELDIFASMVSHNLKEPLRAVATLAGFMRQDSADKLDDKGRERLVEMAKRIRRMSDMISEILEYSRVGRSEAKAEWVALAELVPSVVEELAPPERVRVEIAPGLPVIQGGAMRLRQVFQNLIGNAIKYADKPQVAIEVRWVDAGEWWRFCVADNGPGIEAIYCERIFEMFETLAPKDKTDATGVGLALVRRIVERAGGRVWVESRVGEGSSFFFTWPKAGRGGGTAEPEQRDERMAA
jgi:PAS domain S-box-containing protein